MTALVPPGGELFDTTELDYTSANVQATGFSEVSDWSYEITPIGGAPDDVDDVNFSLEGSGFTFTVSYVDEVGLFPFQFLDYLDANRERQRVSGFDELPPPEDAGDVILMQEFDQDLWEWQITITATGLDDDSPPAPASETGVYTVMVRANYDTSRDQLIEAVDARR